MAAHGAATRAAARRAGPTLPTCTGGLSALGARRARWARGDPWSSAVGGRTRRRPAPTAPEQCTGCGSGAAVPDADRAAVRSRGAETQTSRPAPASFTSTRTPGPHGRGQRGASDVLALRARRLRLHDLVDQRAEVVHQLLLRERDLADGQCTRFVRSRRNSTRPAFASRTARSILVRLHHGAGARVRHQAARAQDAAQPADLAHQLALREHHVEVRARRPATRAMRSSAPTTSAPAAVAMLARLALGEDRDAHRPPEAVRHHHRAADLLVGVAAIEARAQVHLDRLVELGGRGLFDQRQRLVRRVRPCACRPSRARRSMRLVTCGMAT